MGDPPSYDSGESYTSDDSSGLDPEEYFSDMVLPSATRRKFSAKLSSDTLSQSGSIKKSESVQESASNTPKPRLSLPSAFLGVPGGAMALPTIHSAVSLEGRKSETSQNPQKEEDRPERPSLNQWTKPEIAVLEDSRERIKSKAGTNQEVTIDVHEYTSQKSQKDTQPMVSSMPNVIRSAAHPQVSHADLNLRKSPSQTGIHLIMQQQSHNRSSTVLIRTSDQQLGRSVSVSIPRSQLRGNVTSVANVSILTGDVPQTIPPANPKTHHGWAGPSHERGIVTTRSKGRRTVFLLRGSDVILFDRLAMWRANNPQLSTSDAWEQFGPSANILKVPLDAVIKLVFETYRYDYILKFKYIIDPRVDSTRRAFEKKLLKKGVFIEREVSIEEPKMWYVKIITPFHVLCAEAQLNKLKMPLKIDEQYKADAQKLSRISHSSLKQAHFMLEWIRNVKSMMNQWFGADLDEADQAGLFKRKNLFKFRGGDMMETSAEDVQRNFFRDSHRSLLTYYLISRVEVSVKDLSTLVSKAKSKKEGIHYLLNEGIYMSMYQLHDDDTNPNTLRSKLRREWVQRYFSFQPMNEIAAYFGEKVALYFGFIGFYNMWLVISSVLGLVVFIYGIVAGASFEAKYFMWMRMFDNELTPWFGLLISLWAIMMPMAWQRQTAYFAWKWSTSDFEKEEVRRPQFKPASTRRSRVTGKQELYFPEYRRFQRQCLSFVIMAMWLFLVFMSIAIQVSIGAYLSPKINNDIAINVITSLLGLLSIFVMKIPFSSVVNYLTEWENYKTESQFEDAYIFKDYLFNFANSYAQLVYYSFVKPNLTNHNLFGFSALDDECAVINNDNPGNTCSSGVTINLLVIFIGGQLIERVQEIGVPWVAAKSSQLYTEINKFFLKRALRKKLAQVAEETNANAVGKPDSTIRSANMSVTENRASETIKDTPSYYQSSQESQKEKRVRDNDSRYSESLPGFEIERRETVTTKDTYGVLSGKSMKSEVDSLILQANCQNPNLNENLSLSEVDPEHFLVNYDGGNVRLPQYYRDDKLSEFPGIRDEYSQKIIQFGYIALFASAFPLAPIFALVNNIYEIRSDAYKILVVYQRSIPLRAQDIGVWESIIRFIAILSCGTNAVLIAFSSPAFAKMFLNNEDPAMNTAIRLGFIIGFHYAVYVATVILSIALPTTPRSVELAMARSAYLDRIHRDQDLEEEDERISTESLNSLDTKANKANRAYTQMYSQINVQDLKKE